MRRATARAATRLQHDHPAATRHGRRHASDLPRARRRDDHGGAMRHKRGGDVGQACID
jgi:hypothetical protein